MGIGVEVGSGVASASGGVGQSMIPNPTTFSLGRSRAQTYALYASFGMRATPSGGSNSAAGCSPIAISVTSRVRNWPGMG